MPSVAPAKGRIRGELVDLDQVDESSDSDVDAASPATESQDAPSDSEPDSDSLDSVSPRKRRRTSPVPSRHDDDDVVDADADTDSAAAIEPKIIKSTFNVPSRIKRNKPRVEDEVGAARPSGLGPEPVPRVTAATDANTTFDSLGVRPWLVQSLANMAIKRPTAIQRESIPMLLKGRDCIGGSRTGSGKTVAFAVPILQRWAENPSAIFGVILTPTR